jgi:hypothetical protein
MMKFPTEWKNKIHVPNHQPDSGRKETENKMQCDVERDQVLTKIDQVVFGMSRSPELCFSWKSREKFHSTDRNWPA